MIAVSFSLPGKVQHRIGVPSRVTAIAMTTWGRSVRKSLEWPKARLACWVGRATPSSSTVSTRSASWSAPSTSQYVLVVSTNTTSRSRFNRCATEANTSAAISPVAASRKSMLR